MAKRYPLDALAPYLPEKSFQWVIGYIQQYNVQLTITRNRTSVLGDYRHAHGTKGHRISVNSSLNKYSFLITLLHELAHLFTYEKFKNKVAPHGKEWKHEYAMILKEFIAHKIFPEDVEKVLLQTLKNPAASSCSDEKLLRVLRNYDIKKERHYLLEQIPPGSVFHIAKGRSFIKGEKIRTRYKCLEPATKKYYLFSAVYEVYLPHA